MARVKGFEIVCPDGKVRHYPFHNEGDARCDAGIYSHVFPCRPSGKDGAPTEFEVIHGPCPEGKHTVREITFDEPVLS